MTSSNCPVSKRSLSVSITLADLTQWIIIKRSVFTPFLNLMWLSWFLRLTGQLFHSQGQGVQAANEWSPTISLMWGAISCTGHWAIWANIHISVRQNWHPCGWGVSSSSFQPRVRRHCHWLFCKSLPGGWKQQTVGKSVSWGGRGYIQLKKKNKPHKSQGPGGRGYKYYSSCISH